MLAKDVIAGPAVEGPDGLSSTPKGDLAASNLIRCIGPKHGASVQPQRGSCCHHAWRQKQIRIRTAAHIQEGYRPEQGEALRSGPKTRAPTFCTEIPIAVSMVAKIANMPPNVAVEAIFEPLLCWRRCQSPATINTNSWAAYLRAAVVLSAIASRSAVEDVVVVILLDADIKGL